MGWVWAFPPQTRQALVKGGGGQAVVHQSGAAVSQFVIITAGEERDVRRTLGNSLTENSWRKTAH